MKCCAWEWIRTSVAMIATRRRLVRTGLASIRDDVQPLVSEESPVADAAVPARTETNLRRVHIIRVACCGRLLSWVVRFTG
jgi:hypothetical protein